MPTFDIQNVDEVEMMGRYVVLHYCDGCIMKVHIPEQHYVEIYGAHTDDCHMRIVELPYNVSE